MALFLTEWDTLSKHKSLDFEQSGRKTTMEWIIYILNCSQCSSFFSHKCWELSSPCPYHSTERVPQENCMTIEQGPVASPLCCLWEWRRKLSAHTSCGFSGRKETWTIWEADPKKNNHGKTPKEFIQEASVQPMGKRRLCEHSHVASLGEGSKACCSPQKWPLPGWAETRAILPWKHVNEVHSAYLPLTFSEASRMREQQGWSNYSLVQKGNLGEHQCAL